MKYYLRKSIKAYKRYVEIFVMAYLNPKHSPSRYRELINSKW